MRKYLEANIEHNTLNMPKETWLKLRKKGIGGSDASSILNLNPYKSSVNVYMEKIDENIEINNNTPYFTEEDYKTEAFEKYSELDNLGRCGVAYANICKEIMPTEERGNISEIEPTG